MTADRFKRLDGCIGLALVLSIAALYAPVRSFDSVSYDDPEYVTANPHVRAGVTLSSVKWAFTRGEHANWFPLTRLSHMLDYQVFGPAAGAQHIVNVVLHIVATLLLFAFLRSATGERWPSAFVAFLFALHPLHVGSVAWIAERKDVLSATFWFFTLWAWTRYVELPAARRYLLALASFALGLMAKPMLVSLPFVLLLLDLWPFRRKCTRKVIGEKIPFFALSAFASIVTFFVQRAGGAVQPLEYIGSGLRLENALITWVVYIAQSSWPVRLAVFYPYPKSIPAWQAAAEAMALAGITFLVVLARRRFPWLAVGWLWYLGTLVPVIGLVQVGHQAHADRYMYIPLVGLGIMLAWGGAQVGRDWGRTRRWVAAVAALVCLLLAADARTQLQYWRNSESLYRRALDVTTGNYMICSNLGNVIAEDPARLPEAADTLRNCLRIKPDYADAHNGLGAVYMRIPGRLAGSIDEFQAALRIAPGLANAHSNLGMALLKTPGHTAEAIEELETAVRIDPENISAQRELGALLSGIPGRLPDAIEHFERAVKLDPADAPTQDNLGVSLARIGRGGEAIEHFEEAVRIDPNNARSQMNLGVALVRLPGRVDDAISHFEQALRIRPDPELRRKVDGLEAGRR